MRPVCPFDPKYYSGIEKSRAEVGSAGGPEPPPNLPPFDLGRLRGKGWKARLGGWVFEHPDWWLSILRFIYPRARCGRFLLLTRHADVREVLERQSDFPTPYGDEMSEFAGGANFILGLTDGEAYRRQKSVVLSAFDPSEVETKVRPLAAEYSQAVVDAAGSRLNVAWDMIRPVSIKIARDYYGLEIGRHEEGDFADWNLALSQIFFGDPTADRATRELAIVASYRVRAIFERTFDAIAAAGATGDRPMDRLVRMIGNGKTTREEAISIAMGMTTGFAPTVLLAVGNCVDVVLSKPEAYEAVRVAVKDGDDAALDRAIREAMRFKPIWISPWRYCAEDKRLGRYRVRGDTVIWPATRSAMFDRRAVDNPKLYDPGRNPKDSMIFGHGIHMCIGQALALTQAAETFRALFSRRDGFRRAPGAEGKLQRLGAYPEKLVVEFDKSDQQTFVTLVAPARKGVKAEDVRRALAAIPDFRQLRKTAEPVNERAQNPRRQYVELSPDDEARVKERNDALDKEGIIHFASVVVVSSEHLGGPAGDCHVIVELNGDGPKDRIIAAFDRVMGDALTEALRDHIELKPGQDVLEAMKENAVSLDFGSRQGLAFVGAPGHSLRRIRQEKELADAAMHRVERCLEAGDPPAETLRKVREDLFRRPRFKWAAVPAANGLEGAEGSVAKAARRTLGNWPMIAFLGLVYAAAVAISYFALYGKADDWMTWALRLGAVMVQAAVGIATIAAITLGIMVWRLRRAEKAAEPSTASISRERLEELQSFEDQPHYMQNHLAAVSVLHPGRIRRLALRLTFYLIAIGATQVFRPGRLASIGTIHFARWLIVPNTNLLVFCSNYGGSWESYLEDFIMKASKGLTGVWSNTIGFPRTRFVYLDGAESGDRFKRWARNQQVPTSFWYSAYPELTTTHIRRNAMIRAGLCSASDAEAREWIGLFASQAPSPVVYEPRLASLLSPRQPPADPLEHGEIQGLVFGPLGRLPYAHMIAVRLPRTPERRAKWLESICPLIVYGEGTLYDRASFIALSAGGVARLGVSPVAAGFPLAFVQGMADPNRSRILDDAGDSAPGEWLWGSYVESVDAVILSYAEKPEVLAERVTLVRDICRDCTTVHELDLPLILDPDDPTLPGGMRKAREHFGFVDGISQPVIRGTRRRARETAEMHQVNPGEFIMGYRDEHGFYPPSPVLPPDSDPTGILRKVDVDGAPAENGPFHDLGRNGTFLVARQLKQHVQQFNDYCADEAERLEGRTGCPATADWVAAKIVGRWKDGSSLTRNPDKAGAEPDNSFTYGAEDRQGLNCPLGAHIRRSNPRDSLDTDSELEIRISKRHRIQRIGRTYEVPASESGPGEAGLLFMCINGSIERQYEFIQQTWMSAPSFHGLRNEKDPLIGRQPVASSWPDCGGRHSLPSWEGGVVLEGVPSFVTTRGGGYFFMPGRATLAYFRSING